MSTILQKKRERLPSPHKIIQIPEREYFRLRSIERRYDLIEAITEPEGGIFRMPETKSASAVLKGCRESGLYNKAFLNGLEKGLKESGYFSE